MIGGRVLETVVCEDKVWVNCEDYTYGDRCAIYVEQTAKARTIAPGDHVWWQGQKAFWTPTQKESWQSKATGPRDVELARIGFSGVPRP